MTDETADPPRAPSTASRAVLSIVLFLVLLVAGWGAFKLLASMAEQPSQTGMPPARTAVLVTPAERTTHEETLVGYGRARALRSSRVAAELAANVTWVAPELEAGSAVAAGDELVRLDDRDVKNALRTAEARAAQAAALKEVAVRDLASIEKQLERARHELTLAERELERLRDLVPQAASESEVDAQRSRTAIVEQAVERLIGRRATTEADLHRVDADVESAAAAVERARIDQARTSIRAPFAGVIEERHARPGERVTPGTALFDLVDLARIEIPISLPASRQADVRAGAAVTLRMNATGPELWSGSVARVAPSSDPTSRTFLVYVELSAAEGSPAPVAPGAFVTAEVAGTRTPNVIVVPREAFVGNALYVAEPIEAAGDEQADEALVRERRPTIARMLPDVALVSGGLETGELIVVTNVEEIADGGRVRIVAGQAAER